MTTHHQIGKFIQMQRKEIGLTQKDLANKLLVSPQAVSKWETGETLPDTALLLRLAEALETSVDKILSGKSIIAKTPKKIHIPSIIEGLEAIHQLKRYFGEKSTFYQGAIQGINNKMHIDFEASYKDPYTKEVLLAEVIIQYLLDGYTITKAEVDSHINASNMRNIIYRYIGQPSMTSILTYEQDPKLFEQIWSLDPVFSSIKALNELPGEYLRLEKGKNYWATEVESGSGQCFGIAVDDKIIRVFTYGFGGADMKLVHELPRQSSL